MVVVACDLTTEIAGKTRIVAASLHIHNERAKKASCDEVLDEFFTACHTHHVDIFGVDANMGFQRLLLRMPADSVIIRAPAASDCCAIGLFRQPGASLVGDGGAPGGQFYSLWLPDLFWAATDESSHYLLSTTVRPGGSGSRTRAADTAAEKKKRNQAARNERLREAKKKPASAP